LALLCREGRVHCASVLRAIAVTPDADAGSEKINEALLQADFLLVQNSCAPKGMNHLPNEPRSLGQARR
jgi:hypothetical protein